LRKTLSARKDHRALLDRVPFYELARIGSMPVVWIRPGFAIETHCLQIVGKQITDHIIGEKDHTALAVGPGFVTKRAPRRRALTVCCLPYLLAFPRLAKTPLVK